MRPDYPSAGTVMHTRLPQMNVRAQQLAPELIPLLRPEGVYGAALRTVCPQLPEDPET